MIDTALAVEDLPPLDVHVVAACICVVYEAVPTDIGRLEVLAALGLED